MRYGSVCSGIEAATQAWHPLGWTPAFFSEVDKFPSAVLAHHYGSNMPDEPHSGNGVPNYGDMTEFERWPDHAIDILVGGTPCQSFSVAGLRKGLADPRGDLMLTYGAIAQRYKPKWIVWENVVGVLSSNGGRDFGTFLRLLGECGYGFAYRVLDAQYVRVDGFGRAVPQRRRRVFVVGYFGDWRRAAAALSEPEGMSGNPAPIRGAGKETAGRSAGRTGSGKPTFGTLMANAGTKLWLGNQEALSGDYHILEPIGFNAREDCQVTFDSAGPLSSGSPQSQAIAFKPSHFTRGKDGAPSEVYPPLSADADKGDQDPVLLHEWAVRRITPIEGERLQGFPDDHTKICWRGRGPGDCPDGPRYKALGNSMAVNVMRWIGQRIQMIEDLCVEEGL